MNADSGPDSPHFSNTTLREVVLEAALKILDRDGLHLAADSISYAKVFSHIEETTGIKVTRGSVHERIWASHDDFRRDVLVELVSTSKSADYFVVGDDREQELGEILRSGGDRDLVRLAAIKLVSEWTINEIAQSERYRQVQSAKAIATRFNDPVAAAGMQQMLEHQTQRRLLGRREVFNGLIGFLRLRVKPSLGLTADEASDLFLSSTWAMTTGAFLNGGAGWSHAVGEVEGEFGGSVDWPPWRVFSVGAKALFDFIYEVDPAAPPPSAPRPGSITEQPERVEAVEQTEESEPAEDQHDSQSPQEAKNRDKSRRRTRGELKQLVLRGGVETLQSLGMNLRPESLSYAAVFAQVYADHGLVVNRASVHKRFWSSHTEFCMEVMGRALQEDQAPDPLLTADVHSVPPTILEDGSLNIFQTAYDTLQAISDAAFRPMLVSPAMLRRMLIKAAIPDQPDSPAKTALKDLVIELEDERVRWQMDLLQETVVDLGFEVRPELKLDTKAALRIIAIAQQTLSVGASFEQLAGGTGAGASFKLLRADGSDGLDEWSPVAVMNRAAFEMFFQPVAR